MRPDCLRTSCDDEATTNAHAAAKPKRKHLKKSRIPAEDFRSVMKANARFYSAFSSLDMVAMEDAWLNDNRCICHFPGMKRLESYSKIMKSFKLAVQAMDGATRRNWMEPTEIQVEFQTSEKATVFCTEYVYSISCAVVEGHLRPESELIQKLSATNGFKKVNGKWHLWYHQASSVGGSEAEFRVHSQGRDAPPEVRTRHQPPAHTYSDMTMSQATFDTAKMDDEDRFLCAKDLR